MDIFFLYFQHGVVITGMIALSYFNIRLINNGTENNETEKIIRVISFTTGFLIYISSKHLGVSVQELTIESAKNINTWYSIIIGIAPFVVGIITAISSEYALKKEKDNLLLRIIIMFSSALLVLMIDCYTSYLKNSKENEVLLVQNVKFIIGLSLYIILKFKSKRTR